MTREEFEQLAGAGVILLDGATGSNLTKAGMPKGVSTELWVLEHPDILANLQKAYVEAGSQIVYAPTFGANRLKLADYGLSLIHISSAERFREYVKDNGGTKCTKKTK